MAALLIGYARVSTDEQDLTAQRDALAALGVSDDRTYVDHGLTGTNRERQRRLELGLSRGDLAHQTGLNWDFLEAIESRGEPPFVTLDAARRLAHALGVDLDSIATQATRRSPRPTTSASNNSSPEPAPPTQRQSSRSRSTGRYPG